MPSLSQVGVECEIELLDGQRHVFYMKEAVVMNAIGFFKKVFKDQP